MSGQNRDETTILIRELASRGADKAGCDGWRAQEMCRQIVQIIDRQARATGGE